MGVAYKIFRARLHAHYLLSTPISKILESPLIEEKKSGGYTLFLPPTEGVKLWGGGGGGGGRVHSW